MTEPPRKKRCGNITQEQKELLCAFIGRNVDLKNNKFTSTFTFKDAQNKWLEIATELNAIPGGEFKDWKSWRKTWQDWKSATKTKVAKEKRCARDTGGGEPVKVLTNSDSAMLNLISKVSLEGDAEILESAVNFNFDSQGGDHEDELYFNSNIDSSEATKENTLSANKQDTISSKCVTLPPTNIATSTKSKEESTKPIPKSRLFRKNIRFEETTKFTQKIADSTEQDVQARREYYAAKLRLMERDVAAKEKIAATCEVISTKILSDMGYATTDDGQEDEDLSYEDVQRVI